MSVFKIQFIGGLGQIGSNCSLVETRSYRLLIDAGILFPREDFFGINYLIPDYSRLPENVSDILFTHGHEDHIGAITHIVDRFPDIRIWATPFCADLISKKLFFSSLELKNKINIFRPKDLLEFDDLKIYPIQVSHSIPETVGLLINHEKVSFSAFYVSDFKIDKKTNYSESFDFKSLKSLSKNMKTRILFADSTNITSKNLETPSESKIYPVVRDLLKGHRERVFVTCFASNIHRIKIFLDVAVKTKRKVVLVGRSMQSYVDVALKRGILTCPEKLILDKDSIDPERKDLIVLLSGCQGDFKGAFRRVASGNDSRFRPNKNDLFILSSKTIPGNEKKVNELINFLVESQVVLHTDQDALVHVSGHPGKKDLLHLYEQFLPTDIIPIHGESYFLQEHIEFIKERYPQAAVHSLLNGDQFLWDFKNGGSVVPGEKSELDIIIGPKKLKIEKTAISQRRKIAEGGALFLSLNKDKFQYHFIGLPDFFEKSPFLENWEKILNETLKSLSWKNKEKDLEQLRIILRRFLTQALGQKVVVYIHYLS